MLRLQNILCSVCFLVGVFQGSAQILTATVTDAAGTPLPYVTVRLVNTTLGSVADENGFVRFELPSAGSFSLEIRSLGYKPLVDQVTLSTGQTLHRSYVLEEEALILAEVSITAGGEDPAYAIMRKAVALRKQNDDRLQAWSAQAYSKLNVYDYTDSTVAYLSENLSTLWVEKPGKAREQIHASRVSGDSKAYSIVGSLFYLVNPYEPLLENPLLERPFVTPLAPSTFLLYDFKLLGTTTENGARIFKIETKPKRTTDPAFYGTIYITEGTFAVAGFDWVVVRQQPLRFLDSLRYAATYVPLTDSLWVPFSAEADGRINFSLLGEKADILARAVTVFSDYRVTQPPLHAPRSATVAPPPGRRLPKASEQPDSLAPSDPDFFTQLLQVDASATKQSTDSTFWAQNRKLQLQALEAADFAKTDSLEAVRATPAYKDSVRRAENKLTYTSVLTTYTYRWENGTRLSLGSPLTTLQYNTAEGWNATLSPTLRIPDSSGNFTRLSLSGAVRYAGAAERVSYRLAASWLLDANRRMYLAAEGGYYPTELSPGIQQVTPSLNTLYTLYRQENFLKLLQESYGRLSFRRQYGLGFRVRAEASVSHRQPLENTSETYWGRKERPPFTPNTPPNGIPIAAHTTYSGALEIAYRPFGRYISLPEGSFSAGSNWPLLQLGYAAGRQERLAGGGTTFHRVSAELSGANQVGLLGRFSYVVTAGYLATQGDSLLFPDQFHVAANQVLLQDPQNIRQFAVLDYYTYASPNRYAEVHYQHNFGGFFLNKVPLIRKLKFHEVASVHAVAMPGLPTHTEVSAGISNIRVLRISLLGVGYHWVLTGLQKGQSALRVYIGLAF